MRLRAGFTLIEVLVSVALLSLILTGLYSMLERQRASNRMLARHLEEASTRDRTMRLLYLDILSSDGNITLGNDEFSHICIHSTSNSVYGAGEVSVCWFVERENRTLVRLEGSNLKLPLHYDDRFHSDSLFEETEYFDIYRSKDSYLIVAGEKGKEPYAFAVRGIVKPIADKKKKKKMKKRQKLKKREVNPADGSNRD
jgi:prepilin-type N-terminal cleavage/methylation domain-containing protein